MIQTSATTRGRAPLGTATASGPSVGRAAVADPSAGTATVADPSAGTATAADPSAGTATGAGAPVAARCGGTRSSLIPPLCALLRSPRPVARPEVTHAQHAARHSARGRLPDAGRVGAARRLLPGVAGAA